jgi:hypothetical protein
MNKILVVAKAQRGIDPNTILYCSIGHIQKFVVLIILVVLEILMQIALAMILLYGV